MTTPAQSLYYALSDGPRGCFRYGFGTAVGCLHEHGDYVRAELPSGYFAWEATKALLRRLFAHVGDATNLWVLLLAMPWGLRTLPRAVTRLSALYIFLHIAAYTPFYFDGNYPGGGARFFIELLPLELALVALGAHARFPRLATCLPQASFIAFAIHATFSHEALRDRDGGGPLFRASVLGPANASGTLVFVDTDHGWNLAHADAMGTSRTVARYRGDAFDRLLYDRLKAPLSFRYVVGPAGHHVEPYVPPPLRERAFVEAESFWPPRQVEGGFAFPKWPTLEATSPVGAASGRVYAFDGGAMTVHVPLPATRVRLRNCPPASASTDPRSPSISIGPCEFGPWLDVPAGRIVQLGPLPCDGLELSFPVADRP